MAIINLFQLGAGQAMLSPASMVCFWAALLNLKGRVGESPAGGSVFWAGMDIEKGWPA
jgi:hypothetical protein